ncbi:hypothetical protein PPERSA_04057 [Pseudocohnilembus persalinus]|uniref:Uncharacterized protein n=1 Tax=Pseudocohnilembus persalinus TaxID=266149 RepID=A0A0V0QKW4_PSEPJ|nr:hypothetical protein PPERSA_04057 [Pseudocohnilembus persalinus]|eukprot:KRX02854.1 hypothetical protein PPERSA_04057 [Pseudocohnilembus persalinus]
MSFNNSGSKDRFSFQQLNEQLENRGQLSEDKEILLIKCKTAIEELTWELEKAQNENIQITEKNKDLFQEFQLLQQDQKQYLDEMEQYQEQLIDLKQKNDELQDQLNYYQQNDNDDNNQLKILDKKYQVLQNQYNEVCEDNRELKIQNDQFLEDQQKFQQTYINWQNTVEQVQQDIEALQTDNQNLSDEIDNVRLQNTELLNNNDQYRLDSEKLEAQIEELQQALENADTINKQNQVQLELKYNASVDNLKTENNELLKEIDVKLILIEQQAKQIKDLKQTIESYENQKDEIEKLHKQEIKKQNQILDEQNQMIQEYEEIINETKELYIEKNLYYELQEQNQLQIKQNEYLKSRLSDSQNQLKKLLADVQAQFYDEDSKSKYMEQKLKDLEVYFRQKDNIIENQKREMEKLNKNTTMYQQLKAKEVQEEINSRNRVIAKQDEEISIYRRELRKAQSLLNSQNEQLLSLSDQNKKQLQLIKTYENKQKLIEQSHTQESEVLKNEILKKEQLFDLLREKYDESVGKILDQRQNIEEQGKIIDQVINQDFISPRSTRRFTSPQRDTFNKINQIQKSPYIYKNSIQNPAQIYKSPELKQKQNNDYYNQENRNITSRYSLADSQFDKNYNKHQQCNRIEFQRQQLDKIQEKTNNLYQNSLNCSQRSSSPKYSRINIQQKRYQDVIEKVESKLEGINK